MRVPEMMPVADKPVARESFSIIECLLFVGCASIALYIVMSGLLAVFMVFGLLAGVLSTMALSLAVLALVVML